MRSESIGPNKYLQVVIPFTAASLSVETPRWQVAALLHDRHAPWLAGLALLIVAGGCAAMVVYWRQHGRDVTPEVVSDLRVVHPPIDRAPALAGMIKDDSAEAQWQHGLGTSARPGAAAASLRSKKPRRPHDGEAAGAILSSAALDAPANLLPHESALLNLLFEDKKKGRQDSIKMSALGDKSSQWNTFGKPLQEDMAAAGLFSEERQSVRARIGYASIILFVAFVVGLFVAVALISRLRGWVMAVPFAILAVDAVVFIAALAYSPQSDRAALERPRLAVICTLLERCGQGQRAVCWLAVAGGVPAVCRQLWPG